MRDTFATQATLLPIEEVRRLSRLSFARGAWSVAHTFGLAAAWIVLALTARGRAPWLIPLCIVGVAAQQHAFAVLAHEAAHYRLFEARWLNDLFGRLSAAPLGISMLSYRIVHRIHHNHLYQDLDPDLALMAGYPRGRWYLARKLLKDLSGATSFKTYLYFLGKPQGQDRLSDTSAQLRRAARHDRHLVIAANLAAIALFAAAGGLVWYLLLWFLPAVTLLQAILRLRAVCEHGAVPDPAAGHPLRAARTVLPPMWIRWLLFPLDVHFHIEHHLYPSIPHYRLAECHAALATRGAFTDAEVVTLRGTLGKVFAPRAG